MLAINDVLASDLWLFRRIAAQEARVCPILSTMVGSAVPMSPVLFVVHPTGILVVLCFAPTDSLRLSRASTLGAAHMVEGVMWQVSVAL